MRGTWGSVAKTQAWPHTHVNGRMQLLFVLAHRQLAKQVPQKSKPSDELKQERQLRLIQDEADIHGDLLYIDMNDSYFNLTLKLMSAFKWVRDHCSTVKFILKVDTDTFVNVPLLVDLLMLNENRLQFSVTGHVFSHERTVHRKGVWALNSSLYPPPIYPVYVSGCNYILSASALGQMVELLPFMPVDHMSTFLGEDYFVTGVLGLPLALEFFDVQDKQVFGACKSTSVQECELIADTKIIVKLDQPADSATRLRRIWATFFKYYD